MWAYLGFEPPQFHPAVGRVEEDVPLSYPLPLVSPGIIKVAQLGRPLEQRVEIRDGGFDFHVSGHGCSWNLELEEMDYMRKLYAKGIWSDMDSECAGRTLHCSHLLVVDLLHVL